jgi:hypothetical protein
MNRVDITNPFSHSTNRGIGNGLIILAILLWAFLPYSIWKKKQFSDGAAIAIAHIIRYEGAPIISYRSKSGDVVTATLDGWRPGDLKKGDVEIAYSLKDPQRVELTSDLWTGQVVLAILALFFGTIGWLMRTGRMVAGPLKTSGMKIGL